LLGIENKITHATQIILNFSSLAKGCTADVYTFQCMDIKKSRCENGTYND